MPLLSRGPTSYVSCYHAKQLMRLLLKDGWTLHGFVRTLSDRSGGYNTGRGTADTVSVAGKAPPLVSTGWLQTRVIEPPPNFRILDGSWQRSSSDRDAFRDYQATHIPGAQFFDIHECSDLSSPYKAMLPSPSNFENYVSKLGIDNNTHVVVYDNNTTYGMFSAPRVWWMFRVFGHSMVSVLDGGLPKWVDEKRTTTAEIHEIKDRGRLRFKASLDPASVKTYEQMQSNVTTQEFTVLDARSAASFEGIASVNSSGKKGRSKASDVGCPIYGVWPWCWYVNSRLSACIHSQ